MADKVKTAYKKSESIYDSIITQSTWWAKLFSKIFWEGVDSSEIAKEVLKYIPNDFSGSILDVLVGTGVLTCEKYNLLSKAKITDLDYSANMLSIAEERYRTAGIRNVELLERDVGDMPFRDSEFDVALSMNGFHVFLEKEKAYSEVKRVLKDKGLLIACCYVRGNSKITSCFMDNILVKKGWVSPPFDTLESLKIRLEKESYRILDFHVQGSTVYFKAMLHKTF